MASYTKRRRLTIVSGGQTGVDRAALDFAIANEIPHGGWCPQNRLAEDGPIPCHYKLKETQSGSYPTRTEWNIRDSDGTLIISHSEELSGGTALTERLARKHFRPVIIAPADAPVEESKYHLRLFLSENAIETLNIAGPRGSREPSLCLFVSELLVELLDY